MATIDIRSESASNITRIICSDVLSIFQGSESSHILLRDEDNDNVSIRSEDIPNLIKALNKAKELGWYE